MSDCDTPPQPIRRLITTELRHQNFTAGLLPSVLESAVNEVYATLDMIDSPLLTSTGVRLAGVVELANLSSIIGNILANSIVRNCGGAYNRAGAHKYQDLRACAPGTENIEIKVALEQRLPKGHLSKAGHYLSCRYILGTSDGKFDRNQRGDVVWIWEIRLGFLEEADFSVSNTSGDSGKTATVLSAALRDKLRLLYLDPRFVPLGKGVDWYLDRYGAPQSQVQQELLD